MGWFCLSSDVHQAGPYVLCRYIAEMDIPSIYLMASYRYGMRISVLASGSKGNALYIEGDSSALLIDAGISGRDIIGTRGTGGRIRNAGGDPDLVQGLLLTHEHIDHIRSAATVGNTLQIPIWGTSGTLNEFLRLRGGAKTPPVKICSENESFPIGDFVIEPFAVSHDAREPCGFIIREGSTTLCCCSDTGMVTDRMLEIFSHADGLIIESNHCPDMLRKGPYPPALKRRIASNRGHLSNKDTVHILKNLGDTLHSAILTHLSEVNNEPSLVATGSYEGLGLCADGVEIFVASSVDVTTKPSYAKKPGDIPRRYEGECWSRSIEL